MKQALLETGRVFWPENPPLSLSDLAERFDHRELTEQIKKLNQALYSGQSSEWDAKKFWNVFKTVESDAKKQKKEEKIPVPPLYPD